MKKLAKATAKRVLQEPLEIMKSARQQVTVSEVKTKSSNTTDSDKEAVSEKSTPVNEEKIKQKSRRLMEALEAELEDIKRKKKEEEEEKLQEEMLVEKKKKEEEKKKPLIEPGTKPTRKLGGIKGKLSKLKRKAEIRMPPSG